MPKKEKLDVSRVLEEFRQYEESPSHRKGTIKIDIPPDEAIKRILKAKPERERSKKGKK